MRFSQTVLKKAAPEVQELWEGCSAGGGRSGKIHKQHEILKAWVIDPSMGETFHTQVRELRMTESMAASEEWITKRQLLTEMDESEVDEMLELGTLEFKKNPLNPKRLLFKKTRVLKTKKVDSIKKISNHGSKKIEDEHQWSKLNKQLDNVNMDPKLLKKDSKKIFSSLGCAEPSESESENPTVQVKKKVMVRKPLSTSSGHILDKEGGSTSSTKKDPMAMTVEECEAFAKTLGTQMEKNLVTLKSLLPQFKKTMFGTALKVKQIATLIEEAEAVKAKVNGIVIAQTKSLKQSREILVQAIEQNNSVKEQMSNLSKIVKMDAASTKGF